MTQVDSRAGHAALMVAHIAGMVDMVALPLWVGTLMQHFHYSPQQAGATVTLFLLAVAATSGLLSPLFRRLPRKAVGTLGFAAAATAFVTASTQSVGEAAFAGLAALHVLAGVGIGCGLSMAHGAMGRTANPHRMFAWANGLLGVFAVGFLGGMPQLIQAHGGPVIFVAFAVVMGLAALAVLLMYPMLDLQERSVNEARRPISAAAWLAIASVVCLTLNYAMVFSFIERMGMERGFGAERVGAVLLALGLVNLLPSPLAALLEKRVPATAVAIGTPLVQAALAWVIFNAADFGPYAVSAALCVVPAMFGHIFLFGLISRLDASGRAAASTPAMVMLGSSIGPALGGAIVQNFGYPALALASTVVALLAVALATMVRSRSSLQPALARGA